MIRLGVKFYQVRHVIKLKVEGGEVLQCRSSKREKQINLLSFHETICESRDIAALPGQELFTDSIATFQMNIIINSMAVYERKESYNTYMVI